MAVQKSKSDELKELKRDAVQRARKNGHNPGRQWFPSSSTVRGFTIHISKCRDCSAALEVTLDALNRPAGQSFGQALTTQCGKTA